MGVSFSIRKVPVASSERFEVGARSVFFDLIVGEYGTGPHHFMRWPFLLTPDDIPTLRKLHEQWVKLDVGGRPFLDLVAILDDDTNECDVLLGHCR